MATRFRKSKRIGKRGRINFSRSGIGASVGVRGFRISVSPDGKIRRTLSIPGTGIYDAKVVGSAKPGAKKAERKPKRTCQVCGRAAGQKDVFCRYCGARLE